MLTRDDVGRRVVVRRRVATDGGRTRFADTLGELVAADAGSLVVRPDRGGPDVRIELADVAAAKPVPPRRVRVGAAELERIAARAWPAPDTEPLGDWLLRAAGGWTGRANSALAVGDPGMPLADALAAVTAWYAARGLPPACQVPLPLADDVDAELAAAGWHASTPVLVLAAPIDRLRRGIFDLPPVTLADVPSEDWCGMLAARRGLPPAGRSVLTGTPATFAEVRDGSGELLAIGRSAVVERHLGLFAVEVAPGHRRRGLARHVMKALADAAVDRAHTAYLQVEETNAPARALYEGLGFRTHHRYRYRRAG